MAFYLFPGTTYLRLRNMFFYTSAAVTKLEQPYELYKFFSRQYLGFGSLLQFIPGTNANKARIQLTRLLELAIKSVIEQPSPPSPSLTHVTSQSKLTIKPERPKQSPLLTHTRLILGNFFNLFTGVSSRFNYPKERHSFEEIYSFLPIFPIITQTFIEMGEVKLAIRQLLWSIFNPARMLDNTLRALHMVINRILDIGTTNDEYDDDEDSSLVRRLVKRMVGLTFGIIEMPVVIIKYLIDVPLDIAEDLITHVAGSIKDAYKNRNTTVLVLTVEELRAVKEARQGRNEKNIDYSRMSKTTQLTTYYGATKDNAYSKASDATDPKALIALKGSPEKIAQTTFFLSEINKNSVKEISNPEEQSTFSNLKLNTASQS